MSENINRLQELFEEQQSKTAAIKIYCQENKLEYNETVRKRLSKKILGFTTETKDSDTNQYTKSSGVLTARKEDGTIMGPKEFCETYGLEFNDVRSYKLITHLAEPTYNIASHVMNDTDSSEYLKISEELIKSVVEKCNIYSVDRFTGKNPFLDHSIINELADNPVPLQYLVRDHGLIYTVKESEPECFQISRVTGKNKALRVIISDTHIGMDVGNGGTSLYDGKWDAEEVDNRRKVVVEKVKDKIDQYGEFDEIHIIDLGDVVDGWGSQTTRGGHELQQNMDNEEMFDVAVQFKVKLFFDLAQLTDGWVRMFSVTNCNHGGAFAYLVNSAAKQIIEATYQDKIEVRVLRRYIEHYSYGKHNFILCHGKDSKHQKFGMPAKINEQTKDKIENYLKVNNLFSTDVINTFEKGDSHVQILDEATSNDFCYNSYIAFSPPSQWVQHNFTGSKSGFNLMVVDKDLSEKELTTYFF